VHFHNNAAGITSKERSQQGDIKKQMMVLIMLKKKKKRQIIGKWKTKNSTSPQPMPKAS